MAGEPTLMDGHAPGWLRTVLLHLLSAAELPSLKLAWQCECVLRLCQARGYKQVLAWMQGIKHEFRTMAPCDNLHGDYETKRDLSMEQALEAVNCVQWLWAASCLQRPLLPASQVTLIASFVLTPALWAAMGSSHENRASRCAACLLSALLTRPNCGSSDFLALAVANCVESPAWFRLLRQLPGELRRPFLPLLLSPEQFNLSRMDKAQLKLRVSVAMDDPPLIPQTLQICLQHLASPPPGLSWAAAKGFARLASQLNDFEPLWAHLIQLASMASKGALWAMAELFHAQHPPSSSQGSILKGLIQATLSAREVGLRDAACFVLWSAVRYSARSCSCLVDRELFAELVAGSQLDPDASVRRAMQAVLQEAVGRLPVKCDFMIL